MFVYPFLTTLIALAAWLRRFLQRILALNLHPQSLVRIPQPQFPRSIRNRQPF
jgi:hypothetical protein